MKNEGALRMRFLRHDGIYRSDVSSLLFTPGACPAFRSGRCQGIGHAGKNMPCPSSAMSSGRLFLDRVARQLGPVSASPTRASYTLDELVERNYHRTASSGLTGCLSPGVHPKPSGRWIMLVDQFSLGNYATDLTKLSVKRLVSDARGLEVSRLGKHARSLIDTLGYSTAQSA
jgi:hypothetical protein